MTSRTDDRRRALAEPAAPGGEWVTVPREPTKAMLAGACDKHTPCVPMSEGGEECPHFRARRRIYSKMLAAAPAAPQPPAVGVEEALRTALSYFVEQLDSFRESSGGNQADAYYHFVKGQDAAWAKARAALALSPARVSEPEVFRVFRLDDGWGVDDERTTPCRPVARCMSQSDATLLAQVLAAPAAPKAEAGRVEEWPLTARVWKRMIDTGPEWVLEIEGSINETSLVSRHVEPITTAPEDVPGLPTLYARVKPDRERVEITGVSLRNEGFDSLSGPRDLYVSVTLLDGQEVEVIHECYADGGISHHVTVSGINAAIIAALSGEGE